MKCCFHAAGMLASEKLSAAFFRQKQIFRGDLIMAEIVPFKALRPQKQYVKAVASHPYDVVNREEAQKIAEAIP